MQCTHSIAKSMRSNEQENTQIYLVIDLLKHNQCNILKLGQIHIYLVIDLHKHNQYTHNQQMHQVKTIKAISMKSVNVKIMKWKTQDYTTNRSLQGHFSRVKSYLSITPKNQ